MSHRQRATINAVFTIVMLALSIALVIHPGSTVLLMAISAWAASFATYAFFNPRPKAPPVFKIHNPSSPKGTT